jgi:hypothetical protein
VTDFQQSLCWDKAACLLGIFGMPTPLNRRLSDTLLLSVSATTTIDGFWIGSVDGTNSLARVEESITLIKKFDRRRYDRIRRDLDRIWVHLLPGDVARFNPDLRACELDSRFVNNCPPDFIAAAIVHEATHARLWRAGQCYEENTRERIEKICIQQEIIFAAKLPNSEETREWAEKALLDQPDLSDDAFGTRDKAGTIDALRHLGVPDWLIQTSLSLRKMLTWVTRVLGKLR